jgi:hypothetical protein
MNSHITTRKIYYLLDFHKVCLHITMYSDNIINKFCEFVNFELNRHFSIEEQQQLKMFCFNRNLLDKFAYNNVEGISFDGLDDNKLYEFFTNIVECDVDMNMNMNMNKN